jgi:hypothetical protein
MKEWQFDVLFFFALGGALFLLVSPIYGIEVTPTGLTGYGAILTFVLTQRKNWTSHNDDTGRHLKGDDEE